MGSLAVNGPLWSTAPERWATLMEPHHEPLFEAMLDAAGVGAGTRVLDIGCGGGFASALAVSRGADVVGVDAAEGLIAYAQTAVPGATFHVGDIEHLGFDDDSFDVVFAANSVQYAENLLPALRELGRVCKEDGRIVAGLFGPAEGVRWSAVVAAAKALMPPPPPGTTPGGPFALSVAGLLASKFTEAGLHVIANGDVNCPFEFASSEQVCEGFFSGGNAQSMIKIVGEAKLRSAIQAACDPLTSSRGSVSFDPNGYIYVVATP